MLIDLPDLHHIIRYQTVSSANQFQSGLTLTDSAVPCDHQSFPVYIHQHSVNGDTWCQLFTQSIDELCHKFRGLPARSQHRNAIGHSLFQKNRIRFQIPAENHTGHIKFQKRAIADLLLLLAHLTDIRILHIPNNLYTFFLKMLKIPGQLQRRSVNITGHNLALFQMNITGKVFKIK